MSVAAADAIAAKLIVEASSMLNMAQADMT